MQFEGCDDANDDDCDYDDALANKSPNKQPRSEILPDHERSYYSNESR